MPQQRPPEVDDSGFFAPYAEFSKTLRTWFIAYGAGALALLITNGEVHRAAAAAGKLSAIVQLLLIGIAIQVLYAFLYKHAMWHQYCAELDPAHKGSKWYKYSEWLSNSYGLELLGDLATAALFIWATVLFFFSYN